MGSEMCIRDSSYLEYHPAVVSIARSLGFLQVADSLAAAALLTPSFSPNQEPCKHETTGAIFFCNHLNSFLFQETNGKCAFITSMGLLVWSFFKAFIALLPYERVKAMGSRAQRTGITSTPSCEGTLSECERVIIVTSCPSCAKCPARWNTTEPIPPQRGGYSPDTIAMCMSNK